MDALIKAPDVEIRRREALRVLALGTITKWSALSAAELSPSLVQDLTRSRLFAISPEGDRLCVEDWDLPGYPFRVVEIGSGKTTYEGRLQSRVLDASFFVGTQTIYLRGLVSSGKRSLRQQVSINLENGERTERSFEENDPDRDDSFLPLQKQVLLAAHHERQPYRTETLALVNSISYQEVLRVAYATQPRGTHPAAGGLELSTELSHIGLSDDKRYIVYSFDDTLVCRRTADLRVLWSKRVENRLRAHYLALSASGDFVASANSDNGFEKSQKRFSVTIYAGQTGNEVARLSLSGTSGLALSPDGKLVAVSAHESGGDGTIVPKVFVHEVASGRRLSAVAHSEVKDGKLQSLDSVITPAFTSNGKYLVTAGMSTRVWKIGN